MLCERCPDDLMPFVPHSWNLFARTAFLKDANHRVRLAVQQNVPSQHGGIGTEPALPQDMTQQHTIVARLVVLRKKTCGPSLGPLRRYRSSAPRRAHLGSKPARCRRSTLHASRLPRPCTRRRHSGWPSRDSSGWRCCWALRWEAFRGRARCCPTRDMAKDSVTCHSQS